MSSSESEILEELETLGKAVRTFARFEIQALARKLIYQLQRFPASGIFEDRRFKTLWDEFCYNSQEGPFDLPDVGEISIARAWKQTLDGFLEELLGRIPAHIAPLLSNYAVWELDGTVAGVWTDGIKEILQNQLTAYAADRPLGRLAR
jgi:hypothetical protein